MTTNAGGQLSFEDERRTVRKITNARKTYAATLAKLDLEHHDQVLAADHADRLAGRRAEPCRCDGPSVLAGSGSCWRCGRETRL